MNLRNEKDFLSLVQQYLQAKKIGDTQQVATIFQEIVDMMAKHPAEVKRWQDRILRNLTDVFNREPEIERKVLWMEPVKLKRKNSVNWLQIELIRKNLAYRLQTYLSEHHLTVEQMAAIAQVPTCAVEKVLKCGDSSLGDIDNLSIPLQIADVWDFFKAPDDKYFAWLMEQLTEETRQIDQSNQGNGTEIEKTSDGA